MTPQAMLVGRAASARRGGFSHGTGPANLVSPLWSFRQERLGQGLAAKEWQGNQARRA